MSTATTTPADMLRHAAQILAGRDTDHALEENGVGYSKADGGFGHALADTPVEAWSPEVTRAAWTMLRKYKRQLDSAGFNFDAVPEPAATRSERRAVRAVDHDGTAFVLRFTYDPGLIEEVKRLPGRRWDAGRKVWTASHSERLVAFIEAEGFGVTAAAAAALAAPPAPQAAPAGLGSVEQDGPRFVLRTGYDPDLVAAIREIPGRRWDAARKVWTAPLTSVRPLRELAERFNLTWGVSDAPDVEPVSGTSVTLTGGHFDVIFDYDRDMIDAIREIPGAEWNRARQAWTIPVAAYLELATFLNGRDAAVDAAAASHLCLAEEALARVNASAATDAELVIPGLGGDLLPFQRAGVRYALDALGFVEAESRWARPTV